jgi:TonB family protein
MSSLSFRRCRTFGMWPFAWWTLCSCLLVLPTISAQTEDESRQVTVADDVIAGNLVDKITPVYPPVAKAAGVTGTVVLEAEISTTGTIEGLRVLSGPPLLRQAAFDAVRYWRYRPYMVQGEPVRVQTTVNVIFSLSDGEGAAKPASADSTTPAAAPQANPPAAPAAEEQRNPRSRLSSDVQETRPPAPAAVPQQNLPAPPPDSARPTAETQVNVPATPAPVARVTSLPQSSFNSFYTGISEFAAWEMANKDGSPEIFKEFYRKFPNSIQIKTATGTLRGRYWFKVAQPFGDDGKHRDGVIVTAEGMDIGVNLSLDRAKKLRVIGFTPSADTANSDSSGRTFNHTYFEATSGGVLVGNEMITPKDYQNATLILSADGHRLLSWDTTNATIADHPSTQPTMIQDDNGRFACGDACPAPSDH